MTAPTTILSRAQSLVEEFELFDDWMDKYQYVIDLGKELEPIDDAFRTETHKIQGCQSQVWLQPCSQGRDIWFKADSDAQITKGLIAILLRVLNHSDVSEILQSELSFLEELELKEHLSPTRKNGLDAMIKQIKLYAAAIQASDSIRS
ncbi:SufE family protein [bacterium]|nr:SufE family protein [bacterium]